MIFFPQLPVASLQSYGLSALTLLARWVSGAGTWLTSAGACQQSVFVVVALTAVGLLMFVYGILLLRRARRETKKAREDLAELAALRQAAESANEANANLMAGMIPLIRAPVNAIVSFFDLALKMGIDPELQEHLDTVRSSADWLSSIANDAHELSHNIMGKLRLDETPFSISECLSSAMKLVEPEASAKKLITECKIDPQLPKVVCGDPTRLRYLIFNLLDYTAGFTVDGSITLSAALESNSEEDVLIRVAIVSTGIEIPPTERQSILALFEQAEPDAARKSGVANLGLLISRRLVDLMGGSMEAQRQFSGSSTFEFTVRLREQKMAPEASAPAAAPKDVGSETFSILVAEENSLNRRLITKTLESAGHRVWAAANSDEVAHNIQTEGFDAILMDLEMPGSLEAARATRAAELPGLRVPICALTANGAPTDRDQWTDAGIDDFIAKPIVADEVLQLVSKLAGQQLNGGLSTESADHQFPTEDVAEVHADQEEASADLAYDFVETVAWAGTNGFSQDLLSLSTPAGESACSTLSVPAGLALLVKQDDGSPSTTDRNPFEEARKSLSNSRFGVRVIHSDGDPSDRNLI